MILLWECESDFLLFSLLVDGYGRFLLSCVFFFTFFIVGVCFGWMGDLCLEGIDEGYDDIFFGDHGCFVIFLLLFTLD